MIRNRVLPSLIFVLHATCSTSQVVDTNVEISAPIDCVWETVTDLGNWSSWNDVFDITLNGHPQIGTQITIKALWSLGPPSFTRERISRIENSTLSETSDTTGITNITFLRICWDHEELGVPNLSGDSVFLWIPVPLYSVSTDRCIELRENNTDNSTFVRNYIKFESFFGAFVWLLYGFLTRQGFENFNEALSVEVGRTGCS